MPTRPTSPDPRGAASGEQASPFAGLGAGLGAGLDFFQDWIKAAGSALPNLQSAAGAGSTGMPAWTMPTLDPAELEKRIQDLKTVQFWLEQNARMIAMTIQGLEVQRMTLSTLQGMNVSMDALRESLKARADAPPPGSPPAPPPRPSTSASWPARDSSTASGSDDNPAQPATPEGTGQPEQEGAELINPMRWWDTLTQQFTHLASQAAQSVGESVGESMDRLKQAQASVAPHAPAAKPGKRPKAGKGAPATGETSAKAAAKKRGTSAGQAAGKTRGRTATRPSASPGPAARGDKPTQP